MDDPQYENRLYGDLSALPQTNRVGPALGRIIEKTEWHRRLLNGSDYPLPGIMPLYSVDTLIALDFIAPSLGPVLKALREHSPLLFDFVLKRHLRSGKQRFARSVFHTRDFFLKPAGT
jgi:mannonate dehydratase